METVTNYEARSVAVAHHNEGKLGPATAEKRVCAARASN